MDIEERRKALDFLYYEIWMFGESFVRLISATYIVEKNIFLESFLLHARNLIDFLENQKYEDDIRISDFDMPAINISLPQGNEKERINKYLSHLTKTRFREIKPGWYCGEIRQEISKGLKKFLTQLDLSVFPTKVGRRKTDFENLLK